MVIVTSLMLVLTFYYLKYLCYDKSEFAWFEELDLFAVFLASVDVVPRGTSPAGAMSS